MVCSLVPVFRLGSGWRCRVAVGLNRCLLCLSITIYYAPSHLHTNPHPQPCVSHLSSTAEWDKYSSFTTFLSSPECRSFGGTIKPFLTGPAKPQLYETDRGPATCASAPVTEIFQLKFPASGSESELESGKGVQAAEKVWTEFVGVVEREGEGLVRGAIGGRSLDLEGESWVGVLGWENLEVSGGVVMRCGGLWWVVVRMGGADADCMC